MTLLVLLSVAAPIVAAAVVGVAGWQRFTAWAPALAAAVILVVAVLSWSRLPDRAHPVRLVAGGVLRVDALSVTMLLVIGAVGLLAGVASVGYLADEAAHGHADAASARRYGVLVGLFLAAMALAVQANNLGVLWVAIEATTVATAFLVGHRRTRGALEATWKYVIICSTGIAFAFLGTVLLYDASRHAGGGASALNLSTLTAHATHLDPGVTRLAAGLLLLGYGAKAGLAPLHTWLADAHSQAPAPVSALMSGVLLAVAFTAVLRVKAVVDPVLGPGYLRTGLLIMGLLTVALAAALLVAQQDLKRMLAYSSMENMGVVAIAAAAGSRLAVVALLLQIVAHSAAKTVLFVAAGQLQASHGSTAIGDISAVLARSRTLGLTFAVAVLALVGLPPFALFASEVTIARALGQAHLGWALGVCAVLLLVAYVAVLVNVGRVLLTGTGTDAGAEVERGPAIAVPTTVRATLIGGLALTVALGVTAGPLTALLHSAADALGATR